MTEESNSGKLYSLSALNELVGDEEEIRKLLLIFLESTPEMLDDLNRAYDERNIEQLAKSAHKMKTSIDMLRISNLKDIIRRIDKPEKIGRVDGEVSTIVSTINSTLHQVFEQVRQNHRL